MGADAARRCVSGGGNASYVHVASRSRGGGSIAAEGASRRRNDLERFTRLANEHHSASSLVAYTRHAKQTKHPQTSTAFVQANGGESVGQKGFAVSPVAYMRGT